MAGATYTAASIALTVVPDLTGLFSELDARMRGYRPPPIPAPDIAAPDLPPPDTSEAESAVEDGMATAAAAAAVAAAAIFAVGFSNALDMGSAQSRLAAQLGDQGAIGADRAGKIAGNLYAGAWGESMGEVSDVVSNVIRSGAVAATATDEQIQQVSASIMDLTSTFDAEAQRTTAALSSMVRNGLVPSAEAGLDVITRMYQALGPGADDVLDTFDEYSGQFAKIGLDAQFAGGLIVQMMDGGAQNTDKAADALKEFSIRAIDGSKTTVEAYQAIGLNADEMRRRIAAGGPDAQKAMGEVMTALNGVKDPAIQAEAAVGLFGTQAEDLGAALLAMDPGNAVDAIGEVEGAASRMGTAVNDNSTARLTEFGRILELGVAAVITQHVLPALDWLVGMLTDFLALPGVPEVLGFIFSAGAGIAVTLGILAGATAAWTAAQWLWNAAQLASPITWVAIVLGALAGALIYAYNTSEDFRVIVDGVFAWVGEAARRFGEAVSTTAVSVGAIFTWIGEAAGRFGAAFGVTMESVKTIFNTVGGFFVWVFDTIIKPVFDRFPGIIQTTVDSVGRIWDTIQRIFGHPVYFVLETVWNQGIGGLWNAAKGFGLPLGDFPRANAEAIPHFADGGRIPGSAPHKRADNRLIWATPGEYMLDVDDVARLGGPVAIDAARKRLARGEDGLPGLAYGGVVPHVGAAGDEITRLFGPMPGGIGGVGQRANASDHPKGLALDYMTMRNLALGDRVAQHLQANSARMQVKYLIWKQRINSGSGWRGMEDRGSVTANHFDHVHASFLGRGRDGTDFSGGGATGIVAWFQDQVKGLFDGAANGVRSMVGGIFPRNGTFTGDLPLNATDWAINKARDSLFGKAKAEDEKNAGAGGGEGGIGGGVEQWRGTVLNALNLLGLSPSLVAVTLRRMNQESGGNARAQNNWDSNARRGTPSKGLMQMIDPTFRAHWDPRTPNDIWNPLSNITASMRYAQKKYGSLPAGFNRPGGYDQGGVLMPGLTPVLNASGRPETVLPFDPKDLRDRLDRGGRSAVAIANATFVEPVDIDVLMQRASYLQRTGGM
jgi:hypothetical protein